MSSKNYLYPEFLRHIKHILPTFHYKDQSINAFRKNDTVCLEGNKRPINTLYKKSAEFLNVKPGGTNSKHCALTDYT
jgi:hypothetical protein